MPANSAAGGETMMDHSKTVVAEFERQARTFAESPFLQAPELTRRIVDALEDFATGRILDVGCGPGVLTAALSERARQLVGVDLTPEVIRVARQRHGGLANVAFVRGVVERLPFASARFDAVVLRLALHHFEHPAEALSEIRRLLPDGSRLVLLDILTSTDAEVAELHNAIEKLRDPSHARFMPLAALRDTARSAGFTLVRELAWEGTRDFAGWARIINQPDRMASLEVVMRRLARAGVHAGINLREEAGALVFDYAFGLLVLQAG
jgi:ubiquinone/menaquinone biosynthesis C-methylase UbiE